MKKIIALLLASLMIFSLVSCTIKKKETNEGEKETKIIILTKTETEADTETESETDSSVYDEKVFSYQELRITLDKTFYAESDDESGSAMFTNVTDNVAILTFRGDKSSLGSYTTDELVESYIKEFTFDSIGEIQNNGNYSYVSGVTTEEGTTIHCDIYCFDESNAYWIVMFMILNEDYVNLKDTVAKYFSSITFVYDENTETNETETEPIATETDETETEPIATETEPKATETESKVTESEPIETEKPTDGEVYSYENFRITVGDDFIFNDEGAENYNAILLNTNIAITIMREEDANGVVGNTGNYCKMLQQYYEFNTCGEITTTDRYSTFEYTQIVDGTTFHYDAYCFKDGSYYWLIQFATFDSSYGEFKADIQTYADSITFVY